MGSGDESQLLWLWFQPATEAGWQSMQHRSPCCWKKKQLCPPSQPHAPFLSIVPAIAFTQPLASLGRKPVQQPGLENQSSSPSENIHFQWDQVPKGKVTFFCRISDLSQLKMVLELHILAFFLHTFETVKFSFCTELLLRPWTEEVTAQRQGLGCIHVVNHRPKGQQHGQVMH